MFIKTITYTDYDGLERTEDFRFNLTQAELVDMNVSMEGKMDQILDRIIKEKDIKQVMERFKELIKLSYGVKSDDGRRFVKNQEVLDAFLQTPAYDKFFMELATDTDAAAAFVNGIMPSIPENDKAKKVAELTQLPTTDK